MSERLLLDTHTLLWWLSDDARLPSALDARIFAADVVYVSAAGAWEIRTKHRLGKLSDAAPLVAALEAEVGRNGFRSLPVAFADGDLAGALTGDHKDPFDRVLAAQSINHRLALVSNGPALDVFGVVRFWS